MAPKATCEIDHRKGLWVKNSIVLASKHCEIISHRLNKHAHRVFSSSILCVMTSTDNIIDAVVMCTCMTICQQVNPPETKCLDPPLLKQLSIVSVSIY